MKPVEGERESAMAFAGWFYKVVETTFYFHLENIILIVPVH